MYKTRRAVSKVFVFNPKTIKIWKQSKSSNSERESWVGCVCVFHFPLSSSSSSSSLSLSLPLTWVPAIVDWTHALLGLLESTAPIALTSSLSSVVAPLLARPIRYTIFNPKKAFYLLLIFTNTHFVFCVYFPSILESWYSRYGFLVFWVLLNRCQRSCPFIITIEETCSF